MLQALPTPSLVPQGEAQSRRATAKGKSGLEWGLCSYKLCGCSKLKPFDHRHWKPPSQSKPVKPAKALTLAPRVTWPSPAPGAGSPLLATGSLLEMPAVLQQLRIRKRRPSDARASPQACLDLPTPAESWAAGRPPLPNARTLLLSSVGTTLDASPNMLPQATAEWGREAGTAWGRFGVTPLCPERGRQETGTWACDVKHPGCQLLLQGTCRRHCLSIRFIQNCFFLQSIRCKDKNPASLA